MLFIRSVYRGTIQAIIPIKLKNSDSLKTAKELMKKWIPQKFLAGLYKGYRSGIICGK